MTSGSESALLELMMAAPTEDKALAALKVVQNLTGKQLDEAITKEIGNPMLGVIDSLAKAVLPNSAKEQHHRTVHLMVLAYLMRIEAEKK
jgi:hypothetical protein